MTQEAIFVWIEPNYADTPWCHKLVLGIKAELARYRRKAEFVVTKEPKNHLEDHGLVILAGETNGWIDRMLDYTHTSGMRVCLACADPDSNTHYASTVTLDRRGDMHQMMRYFHDAGRHRIALFGVNPTSPADQKRIEGYTEMIRILGLSLDEKDIYPTMGDVEVCASNLIFQIGRYDAIIAGNDLYAIYLLPQLARLGISVPDEMYIAGFGNTYLSRSATPTLTTAALDHVELGRQVIHLALNWEKNHHVTRMAFTVEGHFYARQSTSCRPFPTAPITGSPNPVRNQISSYEDPHLAPVVNLELCLASCDETDRAIISEIMRDQTINVIADNLFISQSTLSYRLNKLYQQAGVTSRLEFESLLRVYVPAFSADTLKSEESSS